MHDGPLPDEGANLPFQSLPCQPTPPADDPPVPLRLVLQPSGLAVEIARAEAVIGRHSEADVRLPLPDVSRRHCRLVFAGGHWQVFDLNSLNGLFVNGERVSRAFLHHHDTLRIGGFNLEVDLLQGVSTVSLADLAHALLDPTAQQRQAG